MRCRACGAEIAANAIVCYRCGAATAEPAAPRRAGASGGRRWVPAGLALAAGAAAAWVALAAGGDVARWVAAGVAVACAAAALRLLRRR